MGYSSIRDNIGGGGVAPDDPPADQVYGRQDGLWVPTVAKGGDTMTGPLVLPGDPGLPLGATPKQYVDRRGVPAGGATGEVLTKAGATDYDVRWRPTPQFTRFEFRGTGGDFDEPIAFPARAIILGAYNGIEQAFDGASPTRVRVYTGPGATGAILFTFELTGFGVGVYQVTQVNGLLAAPWLVFMHGEFTTNTTGHGFIFMLYALP